jgi:hypothetical protein
VRALILILVLMAGAARAEEAPVARLAWRDLVGLARPVTTAAHAEIAALFANAGVRVEWAPAGPQLREPALSVVILNAEARRFALPASVMGLSRPHGGGAWVLYPAVFDTLRGSAPARERLSAEALGRALGRVAAHEIVHALALAHRHAEQGLMCAKLGRDVLLAPAMTWDDASRLSFLVGLAAPPSPERAPDAAAAVMGASDGDAEEP